MPDHSPSTDERASLAQPSQSSSPLECTSHLGFSLGCEYYHNDNGRGARIPKSSIDPIVVRNLKDALKQRGRSAYSVATALGHPSNWLHQILNGKSGLLIPSLRKIAEELGVSMGSLVDDGQDIPNTNGQADPDACITGQRLATTRKGCSTLALTDALTFSASASSLPGSNRRRCPGRIATCQSTSRPRFSSRLWTPDIQRRPTAPSPRHATDGAPQSRHVGWPPLRSGCGLCPSPSPPRCAPSFRNATGSPSSSDASPGPVPRRGSWWTTGPR